MTPDDVRAAAEQLVQFHERFAPLFGKDQAQDHAYDYLKGLMICPERKSIEPIALLVGHGDVSGLQKFVGAAPWAYDDVMAEAQALFADELAPSAAGSPVGVVGVISDDRMQARRGPAGMASPARDPWSRVPCPTPAGDLDYRDEAGDFARHPAGEPSGSTSRSPP